MAKKFFLLHYNKVKNNEEKNMDRLSKEKLDEIKNSQKLTNKDIANKTGLPISTIDKLFSGINSNPTLETLRKVASALNCNIDDFIEYDNAAVSRYYLDRKAGELAQEIHDNPDLRILLDASKKLSPEDIKIVIDVANGLKKNR